MNLPDLARRRLGSGPFGIRQILSGVARRHAPSLFLPTQSSVFVGLRLDIRASQRVLTVVETHSVLRPAEWEITCFPETDCFTMLRLRLWNRRLITAKHKISTFYLLASFIFY
jgi:hypothetical protein